MDHPFVDKVWADSFIQSIPQMSNMSNNLSQVYFCRYIKYGLCTLQCKPLIKAWLVCV